MHVNGEEHIRSINGKYLKYYKPSFNEIDYQHKKFWKIIRHKASLTTLQVINNFTSNKAQRKPENFTKVGVYLEDKEKEKKEKSQLFKSNRETSPTH